MLEPDNLVPPHTPGGGTSPGDHNVVGGGGGGSSSQRNADDLPCPSGQCKDVVTGQCRSFNPRREKVNMTDTWERSAGPDWAGRVTDRGGRGYCRQLDRQPNSQQPATPQGQGGGGGGGGQGQGGGGAVLTGQPAAPAQQLGMTGNALVDSMLNLFNNRAGIFGTANPFLSSATPRTDPNQPIEGMLTPGGGLWWGQAGSLSDALMPMAGMFGLGGTAGGASGAGGAAAPFGGGGGGGEQPGNPAVPGCDPTKMYKVGHPCAGGTGTGTGTGPGAGGTIPPGGCQPGVMYKVGHPCANQGILATMGGGGTQGLGGGMGPLSQALFGQGLSF